MQTFWDALFQRSQIRAVRTVSRTSPLQLPGKYPNHCVLQVKEKAELSFCRADLPAFFYGIDYIFLYIENFLRTDEAGPIFKVEIKAPVIQIDGSDSCDTVIGYEDLACTKPGVYSYILTPSLISDS